MSTKHANFNEFQRDVNNVLKMDVSTVSETPTATNYMDYCKPPYIFVLVPIVFALILFYIKPSFIMDENPDNKEELELSYKKLAIYTLILTVIVIAAYYYFYGKMGEKKEKSN